MRLTETVTPLKPLEAMAQGRLLVASDVGGHRELIRDGETGVLFAPTTRRRSPAVDRVLVARARWPQLRARAALRRTRAQLGGQRVPLSPGVRTAVAGRRRG